MRHRIVKKKLSRDVDHRKALLANLSKELINHEKIVTTLSKAKYVRPHIEMLITKAKGSVDADKITVFNTVKYLKTKQLSDQEVRKLIEVLAPRFKDTKGGYTKLVRTGYRGGDNSLMARIELVKKETPKEEVKKTKVVKKEVKSDEK